MEYRAVGGRCAVNLNQLPFRDHALSLAILSKRDVEPIKVDLIELARSRVGKSLYQLGARMSQAPSVVDCSSFSKWLYAQYGVWLPRLAIQQREYGEVVEIDSVIPGDLLFTSGRSGFYRDDPADSVGHVGVVASRTTVIHAACEKAGVVEATIETFVGSSNFRGARRYIPKNAPVVSLKIPQSLDIETSEDIKFIMLRLRSELK